MNNADVRPFRIAVADAVLDDLRARLRNTRWPEAELVDDWRQGAPLQWIQRMCSHWAEGYDWRSREAALNRFEQFQTELDGLDVSAQQKTEQREVAHLHESRPIPQATQGRQGPGSRAVSALPAREPYGRTFPLSGTRTW